MLLPCLENINHKFYLISTFRALKLNHLKFAKKGLLTKVIKKGKKKMMKILF